VSPPIDAGFVGGGRTLGQHFDAAGNLIFCHAATVRSSLRPSGVSGPSSGSMLIDPFADTPACAGMHEM